MNNKNPGLIERFFTNFLAPNFYLTMRTINGTVLNGFIKKSQKMPEKELGLARKRRRILRGGKI